MINVGDVVIFKSDLKISNKGVGINSDMLRIINSKEERAFVVSEVRFNEIVGLIFNIHSNETRWNYTLDMVSHVIPIGKEGVKLTDERHARIERNCNEALFNAYTILRASRMLQTDRVYFLVEIEDSDAKEKDKIQTALIEDLLLDKFKIEHVTFGEQIPYKKALKIVLELGAVKSTKTQRTFKTLKELAKANSTEMDNTWEVVS